MSESSADRYRAELLELAKALRKPARLERQPTYEQMVALQRRERQVQHAALLIRALDDFIRHQGLPAAWCPIMVMDPLRCQCEVNTGSFMTLGIPKPERCKAVPLWIAEEVEPAEDGQRGSMSLCGPHRVVMESKLPGKATFRPVVRELPGLGCTECPVCESHVPGVVASAMSEGAIHVCAKGHHLVVVHGATRARLAEDHRKRSKSRQKRK